jgi:hypothetical protein
MYHKPWVGAFRDVWIYSGRAGICGIMVASWYVERVEQPTEAWDVPPESSNGQSERPQIPNRIVPVTSRPSCQASNWNPRSNVYLYSFNVNIFYTFVSTLTITLALSFLSTVTTV